MKTELALCEELFNVVTRFPDNPLIKLSFTPNEPSVKSDYFIDDDKEIICFKGTFLKVFKEAHDYFEKHTNIGMFQLAY